MQMDIWLFGKKAGLALFGGGFLGEWPACLPCVKT